MANSFKTNHLDENRGGFTITNFHYVYYFGMISLALLSSLVILLDNYRPPHYKLLPLLPLSFALASFVAFNAYKNYFKKLSITIIISTYFVRMVVLPFMMYKASYVPVFSYNKYFPEIVNYSLLFSNMNKAILLMCYELIVVFIVMSIAKFSEGGFYSKHHSNIKTGGRQNSKFFKQVLFIILLYIVVVLYLFPQMGSYLRFFIATSVESDIKNFLADINMKETVPSIIYWSYRLIFDLAQVFVPVLLVGWIYNFFGYRLRRFGLLFSFLVILATFVFMTPQKATSLQLGLSLLLVVCMLYPDIMRFRAPILFVSIALLAVVAIFLKSGGFRNEGQRGFEFIAYIVNAYFGGPLNVASGISMPDKISMQVMMADFLRSIPFVQYFFKDMIRTPDIYNGYILKNAPSMLIIPMVAQGKFYLGSLLSPLFSLLAIQIAFAFERLAEQSNLLVTKFVYLYATTIIAMVPVMYNLNILYNSLFIVLLSFVLMKLSESRLMSNGIIRIGNKV